MTLSFGNGANVDASEIWIGAAGGNAQVVEGWLGTEGGNALFFALGGDGGEPEPLSAEYAFGDNGMIVSVIASGGVPSYAYDWEILDGDGFIVGGQGTATCEFAFDVFGVFLLIRCTVTDADSGEVVMTPIEISGS